MKCILCLITDSILITNDGERVKQIYEMKKLFLRNLSLASLVLNSQMKDGKNHSLKSFF